MSLGEGVEQAVERYGEIASKAKEGLARLGYPSLLEPDERVYLDAVVDAWNPYGAARFLFDLYEDGADTGDDRLMRGWEAVSGFDDELSEREAVIYASGAAYEAGGIDRLLEEDTLVDALNDVGTIAV